MRSTELKSSSTWARTLREVVSTIKQGTIIRDETLPDKLARSIREHGRLDDNQGRPSWRDRGSEGEKRGHEHDNGPQACTPTR